MSDTLRPILTESDFLRSERTRRLHAHNLAAAQTGGRHYHAAVGLPPKTIPESAPRAHVTQGGAAAKGLSVVTQSHR